MSNNEEKIENFTAYQLEGEPAVNVIEKEQFEERVGKVFTILWEKLSKSFGPYGSGTFISQYPYYHNSKDGFTIMKSLSFNKKLDQVISDMASTICGRLNTSVGDGTTSAIIATKSIYDSYRSNKRYFTDNNLLPRDILNTFESIKNEIITSLDKEAVAIRSDDPETLSENIKKVVYISSNGDEDLTKMISDLYAELMYPAINVELASDGITKSRIITGYNIDVTLTDKLYTNSDDGTMKINNGLDVIVFDHKVTISTYNSILKPLNKECRDRGRHLLVIAPFYDETALDGVIASDLNTEFKQTKNINMVLAVCKNTSAHSRQMLSDLAMLLNTQVINRGMEEEIITKLNEDPVVLKIFDVDDRKIPNISVAKVVEVDGEKRLSLGNSSDDRYENMNILNEESHIQVGYCGKASLGLIKSTFDNFYYDEDVYKLYYNDAKNKLDESIKKYQQLGTFNLEVSQNQRRLYALGLKMGVIEVGGSSDITRDYFRDMVDDAVKAAQSAYDNGVILGCNITTMRCINDLYNPDRTELENMIIGLILGGFKSVYKTVLSNRFIDRNVTINDAEETMEMIFKPDHIIFEPDIISEFDLDDEPKSLQDTIVNYSIMTNQVFDLSTSTFSKDVINSCETDKEILKATIDLISLLVTGNQLVLC